MGKVNLQLMPILLFFCLTVNAQQDNDEKKTLPPIFNQEERDSLQLWFYDRATVMGLKGEKRDTFYNVILNNSARIRNLFKRQDEMNSNELVKRFENILGEQNMEIRKLLTEKQYDYYLQTYGKILDSIYHRRGWKRIEEKEK